MSHLFVRMRCESPRTCTCAMVLSAIFIERPVVCTCCQSRHPYVLQYEHLIHFHRVSRRANMVSVPAHMFMYRELAGRAHRKFFFTIRAPSQSPTTSIRRFIIVTIPFTATASWQTHLPLRVHWLSCHQDFQSLSTIAYLGAV